MANDRPPSGGAPTTNIETLVIVRPLKVIAVILAGLAVVLMLLSIAATTWLEANQVREGLWEKCRYRGGNETDMVDCNINLDRDWLKACRGLCIIVLIFTFVGIVVASIGLRSADYRSKYRYYIAAMVIWFAAVVIQLIVLITFPIKFLEEIENKAEATWNFGWAYGIGWGAAICDFTAGLFMLLDKGKEEVIYKEITVKGTDSLEEEEV